jgi:hypothetical protein
MPSNQSIQQSQMQDVLATQGGNVSSGETMNSQGQSLQVPNIPSPPAPFENMPVMASDVIPQ